jgi:hypothetical protein
MRDILALIVAVGCTSLPLWGQQNFKVSEMSGGIVMTDSPTGTEFANGELKWFVVNQAQFPCKLEQAGVVTTKTLENYVYITRGQLTTAVPVTQIEVEFILFDSNGKQLRALVRKEDVKLSADDSVLLDKRGPWTLDEREAASYRACVAFVSRLVGADGTEWSVSMSQIQELLNKLQPSLKRKGSD